MRSIARSIRFWPLHTCPFHLPIPAHIKQIKPAHLSFAGTHHLIEINFTISIIQESANRGQQRLSCSKKSNCKACAFVDFPIRQSWYCASAPFLAFFWSDEVSAEDTFFKQIKSGILTTSSTAPKSLHSEKKTTIEYLQNPPTFPAGLSARI